MIIVQVVQTCQKRFGFFLKLSDKFLVAALNILKLIIKLHHAFLLLINLAQ